MVEDRPLFKKPAWAQSDSAERASDFFRRSSQVYNPKSDPSSAEKASRGRRDRPLDTDESDSDEDNGLLPFEQTTSKKPAVSIETSKLRAESHSSDAILPPDRIYDLGVDIPSGNTGAGSSSERQIQSKSRTSHNTGSAVQRATDSPRADVIEIAEEQFSAGEQEAFPELARRAREANRKRHLAPDSDVTLKLDQELEDGHINKQKTIAPAQDPCIQILITSPLPNSKALIVNRRLSQSFREARLAWISKQNLSDTEADSIFLCWRRKRVFDATTCRNLGLFVSDGAIHSRDGRLGTESAQLHLIAVNQRLFKEIKARINGSNLQSKSAHDNSPSPDPEKKAPHHNQEEKQVKIILKAKNFPDCKLIVKPTTLVAKVMNAFRSTNQIDARSSVVLQFDGESLQPDSQIDATDISDMDTIDVYVT